MTMQDGTPGEIAMFINYLYGQESRSDATGVMARYVQNQVTRRPADSSESRWPSFDALRTLNAYYKFIDPADFEAVIAAFRAR